MYDNILSLIGCFILSFGYVSSLYVWGSQTSRNLPQTIKKRFISCFVNMMVAPFLVEWIVSTIGYEFPLFKLLGLRLDGLLAALFLPLALTAGLFLGPISVNYMSEYEDDESFSWDKIDLFWLRNHVVGPLSEEFIFRSCMLSILIVSFAPSTSIALSSLFFGAAHLHHIYSNLYEGHNLKSAVLIVGFQVLYTSLFGAYSSFLFLRTGHFVAPFLAHTFCNHMGFPNVQEIFQFDQPKKSIAMALYIVGLVLWMFFLVPATDPRLYSNDMHWKVYN